MNERISVHHFDSTRGWHRLVHIAPTGFARQQNQNGANPFASGLKAVFQGIGKNRRTFGADREKPFKFAFNTLPENLKIFQNVNRRTHPMIPNGCNRI